MLPEEAWFKHYYSPMEARLDELRSKYAGDAVAESVLQECADEIDFYRRYRDYYGYCFFVLAR